MAGKFILKMPDFRVAFRELLHAVNLRHGTHGFTSLPKEGVLRIFFFFLLATSTSLFINTFFSDVTNLIPFICFSN
jgi:hypothetical protein